MTLSTIMKKTTIGSLAVLMGLAKYKNGKFYNESNQVMPKSELTILEKKVLEGTLIRTLSARHFNPKEVKKSLDISAKGNIFNLKTKILPSRIPSSWEIISQDDNVTTIKVSTELKLKTDVNYSLSVQNIVYRKDLIPLFYKQTIREFATSNNRRIRCY